MRIATAFAAALSMLAVPPAQAEGVTPQAVIISFDGAFQNEQWQRSLALGRETGARFTYFLSCVYLLTRETAGLYAPPAGVEGHSNVGFAPSFADVGARLDHIWSAREQGHEIASHGCGHFDGAAWSKDQWLAEFEAFDAVLGKAWQAAGRGEDEPAAWPDFVAGEIVGFRAPYLATGDALYAALAAADFSYDASAVSNGPVRPDRASAVVRFSLPMIPEGPKARPVIAMDYNFFARHSGAEEVGDPDGRFEARAYRALREAFERQYAGDRVPLQVGFHFTLMNGGAYWRALERFAREVCTMDDVRCVAYRDYLEAAGSPS